MSGQLRYNSEVGNPNKAIQGPYPKLWLDFSKISGKLSYMKPTESSEMANVSLTWRRYNGMHGVEWRVEVVATKEILPFQELLRPV
jgi:hypothetical protein